MAETKITKNELPFNEVDIKELFSKIVNSKYQVIIIALCCFGLSILYVFNISPVYISSALIQVDSQLGSANSMQQMLGNLDATFSSGGQATPADIEIALLKSRFILESVIEQLKLNVSVIPNYFPIVGSGIARRNQDKGLVEPLFGLKTYAWGGEQLQLEEFNSENKTSEINYNLIANGDTYKLFMPDGTLVAKGKVGQETHSIAGKAPKVKLRVGKIVANKGTKFTIAVKHYDDVLMNLAQNFSIMDLGDKTKTKTGVLQLSLKGTDPEVLPQILTTIINFAVQRDIERKSAEASKTLDFLNRQLPNVRKTLETSETDLNGYRALSGKIDISQEAKIILMQLSAIEQSIAELKLKKIELLQELTPEHPYIKALTQKQVQLQKEMYSLEKKIRLLPETDQKALSLERDVKVKDQLYLLLLNKIQQLQVIKAGTLSDIRVLSQATVPIEPLPSHKYFILLIGAFIGLFIGIAQVLIRDFLRKGVTDTEMVEKKLGISAYGVILYSEKQRSHNSRSRKGNFILAQTAPHDIAIEGIRSLRTMLQFSHNNTSSCDIISILGASPGIGKSFISVNLAQIMFDAGKRVLLIDSDMRKGKLHQHFGLEKTNGLSELIKGECALNQALHQIQEGFDFIPNGSCPSKPTELLLNKRFNTLILDLAKEYDNVIIDTPPILAVSDGIIVAKLAAINLLIIGIGKNHIDELEMATKRIRKNHINIDGLVFNDGVNLRKSHKQYNYYYAYEAN